MSAVGSDSEKFIADAGQQHLLSVHMAQQRSPLSEILLRDAEGEIRASEFRVIGHFVCFQDMRPRCDGRFMSV
jgi:hypothetical protein